MLATGIPEGLSEGLSFSTFAAGVTMLFRGIVPAVFTAFDDADQVSIAGAETMVERLLGEGRGRAVRLWFDGRMVAA